jgi:hypothetical protein
MGAVNGRLWIDNLTANTLAIDLTIDKTSNRIIRAQLGPAGTATASVDVGDAATLDELNLQPQIITWLGAGIIRLRVIQGPGSILGADISTTISAGGIADGSIFVRTTFAAGGAGARDVTMLSSMPFAGDLMDSQLMIQTAGGGGSTANMRTALAGAGAQLTQAMSTAAAGRVRDNGTGQTAGSGVLPSVARGSPLVLRMTDGTAAGTAIAQFLRTS